MLNKHGRVKPKERYIERGQKNGTVVPCHVARSCLVCFGHEFFGGGQGCLGVQFSSDS